MIYWRTEALKMSPVTFLLLYHITQISFMLQVYSVIDYRKCQNVVRTSVTHSPCLVCLFSSTEHFFIICDLLLNRSTATWEIFVRHLSISQYVNQWRLYKINVLLFPQRVYLSSWISCNSLLSSPISAFIVWSTNSCASLSSDT